MTGRHRRTRTTPAQLVLLGAVPLLGGAGMVTALLGATTPGPDRTTATATTADTRAGTGADSTAPPSAPGAAPVADRTVPGRGELALDAVGGARDAARRAGDEQVAARVSTVAAELRDRARERAAAARAAGDAELAAYHRAEAARYAADADSSRPVLPAVPDDLPGDPTEDGAPDPGGSCTAADVVRLGPLTATGPSCANDPWVAGQVQDALGRGGLGPAVG
ncbi:hypothetical protein [Pseudonocardia spirodelae]|uniref:Uncharacterized protein n=1 Tax=Pseudonocardia spirodelae TaxID=3133431 RepID=A0ABU8TA39_9PSEU